MILKLQNFFLVKNLEDMNLINNNILITGAAGRIGSAIAKEAIKMEQI